MVVSFRPRKRARLGALKLALAALLAAASLIEPDRAGPAEVRR